MADLAVTATQVLKSSLDGVKYLYAGEVIDAGEAVFEADDGLLYLSDNDDTALDECDGIALNSALAIGQPVAFTKTGTVVLGAGAAPVNGTIYVVADTPGKIMPAADLAATDMAVIILGVGDNANGIALSIFESGVIIPTP